MELIKKTDNYLIYQKRSKRYAVYDADKKAINGKQKIEILVKEKLITAAIPEEDDPAPPPEAASEKAKDAEAGADSEEPTQAPDK